MRFGTYYFLQAPPGRSSAQIVTDEVDQMVLSEELGFDSIWLTEHHYSDYGLSSAPSLLAATVMAKTERIRLGLAVYVIPFHHPLRLAEETATLDILSGGRLTVGIGRGNRALEFVGSGVRQEESRQRMEEGVEVLLKAWGPDPVTFHGKHWNFDAIPVYPKPLTQPHPPIAFAASSPDSLQWAARNGFAIMSSGLTTPLAAALKSRQIYLDELQRAGRGATDIAALLDRWVMSKHVYVAPTDAEARADAEGPERWYLDSFCRSLRTDGLLGLDESVYRDSARMIENISNHRWEDLLETSLLIGSPSTIRRKVSELQAGGVGELICWMNFGGLPPDKVRRSMRLFSEEVMPAFRAS